MDRSYADTDVSSTAFWSTPAVERERSFAHLRAHEPVSWQRPADGGLMPSEDDDGFWAVVRHADIGDVSHRPEIFCSGQGVQLENIPEMFLEATQSFLAMDAPRHTALRKLVSSAFTPKRVRTVEEQIRDQARRIVDDLLDAGKCDFVHQVSMRLPMWTIYEMVGLPAEQQEPVAQAADLLVSSNDTAARGDLDPLELVNDATQTLIVAGLELAENRRAEPRDDLMTALVQAEVDGETLTDEEISAFFVLLSVAGNDTTRNTISHTMLALQQNPDQRAWLAADFDERIRSAVEEFVRWATPVQTFKRVATEDTVLAGVDIAAGEKVVMMYGSGNRDEAVFERPLEFDLSRTPNKHVGFGGGGPHFCMGANLAKTQLRAIVDELLRRAPGLELGEPDYLVSNFVHGVKSMPCTVQGA
ncbi:cytochrome P450 [Jatrophihabitans fulvus]